jgi:DNA-binding response OmpR family regulator
MATVLLVDDDQDLVQALSFSLTQNGFAVVTAKNGAEAITMTCNLRPDVILLDIMMPNLDGLSACRGIRSMEQTDRIPVIMLTAKGDIKTIKAAFEAGASDYVVKPFGMDKILEKIREQLTPRAPMERHALSD